jgi:hypothetical protein
MTGLREMIQRELARRDDASAHPWAPERVVLDGSPDDDAKLAAMRAKYPGKNLIVREIVDSPMRFAERPEAAAGAGPSSVAEHIDEPDRAVDAAERARARLARMRGLL